MAATLKHMNWTVSFTPAGGAATPILGVTDVQIDPQGNLLKLSGDGDRFNTTVVKDFEDPMVTIQSNNTAQYAALTTGTVGVLTCTHLDAINQSVGVGQFAIRYVLSNSVINKNSRGGAHRAFGKGSLSFDSYSSDGTTNPLAITVL